MARVTREASARRRRQLHAATVVELARTGPADLALTAVAERCGVTTTTIYRRHPTRDDLLEAVLVEVLAPEVGGWLDRLGQGLDGGLDPLDRRPTRGPDATTLGAWCQVCVAAAWPGPLATGVRSVLRPDPAGAGPSGPRRPDAAALVVGSWLLTTGLHRRPPPLVHQLAAARHHLSTSSGASSALRGDEVHEPSRRRRTGSPGAAAGPILDERGRRLLAATAEAIDRVGYANVSVDAIARRAATSTGAVYNRFSGKAGLLAACLAAEPVGCSAWGPRVEALRLGPALDPEIATGLEATIGRPLRARARVLAGMRREDPGRFPAEVRPGALAWVTTALALGVWVVQRIDTPRRPPAATGP